MSSAGTLNLDTQFVLRPPGDGIRVLIVAAVRLYRDGMAANLDRRDRMVVVGTARNRVEALDQVSALSPDIVVLDMATGESVDLVRTLQVTAPEVRTVAFGVEGDEREIIAFAQAGVAGYVPSDASMDVLTSTIA